MRLMLAFLACATLPAWAAASLTLSAIPPGPSAVGQRVTLLSEVTGVSSPRYRFEVRNAAGTLTYSRDWTTGRSTWWYPSAAGTYTCKALVRSGAAGTPAEATATYVVKPKLQSVITGVVSWEFTIGTPVTVHPITTGGGTVEYRLIIGYSGRPTVDSTTVWDQTRPWTTDTTWTFTPTRSAYYFVRIYARERGSTAYYDVVSWDEVLHPLASSVTSFRITATPAGAAVTGTTVALAVSTVHGGVQPVWKFAARAQATGAWTLIRDYAAAPTATWTLPAPGVYSLYAIARESWKTGTDYDRQQQMPFVVLSGQRVNATDGSVLLYVPAGTFLMGTPANAGYGHPSNEEPQRTVSLTGYWIMRDEVTVAQYQAFCSATGRAMPPAPTFYPRYGQSTPTPWAVLSNYPMVNVTWADAQAYAAWAGLALPTEAQWEKAARGSDGRLWPWGNTWDAHYCADYTTSVQAEGAPLGTWPVGSLATDTSPYGCHDMAGNVWEWCADWYGAYDPGATDNPTGPQSGAERVARGGMWDADSPSGFSFCTSRRWHWSSAYSSGGSGFRCVSNTAL